MNGNGSVLLLAVLFAIGVLIRICLNHLKRKATGQPIDLFGTKDVSDILFNVGLLTAGVASILLALGYHKYLFGPELAFTQPIINFLAGVLFIWFSSRNMFYEGKV